MVQLDGLQLSVELVLSALLRPVLAPQIHPHLVLLVQVGVLGLHNVHLNNSARGVLFRAGDADLLPVVLQLADHVVEHSLQLVQVAAHGELLPVFVATKQSVLFAQKQTHSLLRTFHLNRVNRSCH